jgi:hypothetical protein
MEISNQLIFLYDVGKKIYKSNVYSKRLVQVLFLSSENLKCYVIYKDGITYDITKTKWPTDMTYKNKMCILDKNTATMMLLKSKTIEGI